MADAAVSFAIENVGNFLIQKAKFLHGVRDEVEEMQIELEWMQCFLMDADKRQGESHRIHNWVSQIREAAYDVDDVIEHFILKSALRMREGVVNRIKRYVFFINHVVELHQVGSRIEAVKTRLANLRTRLQIYGIKELRVGGQEAGSTRKRKRQDYVHVIDHNVVGLDQKISELVTQLLGPQEKQRDRSDSVVCISGMGGLGKTTLAKKLYDDSRIRAHFEGFAWVYISKQFNSRDVWASILGQLSAKKVENMAHDELASKLCQFQRENKCLVVIDDIWSNQDWNKLSAAFPYLETDSGISKILLTSRYHDVALHGVSHTSLETLNQSHSLELLINTIQFLGGPKHPIKDNSRMRQRAREIIKQCGGLPLAIVVLGGILARKHELKEWVSVIASIKLFLNRGNGEEDGVNSVLESSYNDLSYNLKSCFLYLSQYPEDHELRTTELKQRWMGEGFVPYAEDGDETMDDVAEQYLNELISRCMIQAGKKSHTGRVKTCRIHDLMRDMCISKAKEEGFMHVINLGGAIKIVKSEKTHPTDKIRRLCIFSNRNSLHHFNPEYFLLFYHNVSPHLRSMLWFGRYECQKLGLIVKKLKLVRVLVLEKAAKDPMEFHTVGKEIGNLLHLRYLSLRSSEVDVLPTNMDNLRCLQSLDLRDCRIHLQIPNSIWRMEQLRHLYLPRYGQCESDKQRVGDLQNLQTLVNFPPKKFDLKQNLERFTDVRKLQMQEYSFIVEAGEIFRSKKIVFKRLHSLTFETYGFMGYPIMVDIEATVTACPNLYKLCVYGRIQRDKFPTAASSWPSNLTKLVFQYSQLDARHMEPLGKLQSLKILFLFQNAFDEKEMIFHENDFPQLQHLVLEELFDLEAWTVHGGALPSLSRLVIKSCKKLRSVPDRFQFLEQLKEVEVRRMPYDFRKRLELGGDDWNKVSRVSSISFIDCDKEPETEIQASSSDNR